MNSKTKKGIISSAVVFMSAALFMGGTLAWSDYSQHQVNRFRGNVDHDVTLHDDFDGENKDVYVENSGESTIYVRVRLDEYMQIGNINMLGQDITAEGSVTARTKEQWVPHTYDKASVTDCEKETDIKFHGYYEWNMSGDDIQYDPGTPGLVSSVLDGTKKDADGNELKDAYGQTIPAADPTVGEKTTLPASTPVLMSDYIFVAETLKDTPFEDLGLEDQKLWKDVEAGCWILDDTVDEGETESDGWAYWSQPLEPGTATNLLLDEVKPTSKTPSEDWYYAIDVKLQAVSLDETETMWDLSGGYSTNAAKLIESWHN